MPVKPYLEAGQVVGTHGVRGELRVQVWCDTPEQFAAIQTLYFAEGGKGVKAVSRPHKRMALCKLEGVDTVQEAAALRGAVLYAKREDFRLPKGRYFVADLIGLAIVDAGTGERYGPLTDVSYTGANEVYHLDKNGTEVLIPAIPSVVKKIDIEQGVVQITPIKGLFDDEN